MSTQRYISTSFWDDDWIQSLDPSEKLLYLYLMTNPLTNIAGIYKIANRRISFDTGFNTDTVKMILDKFEKAGKACRYDEYVIIPSWPKHQKWETSSKIRAGIESILKKLPQGLLEHLKTIGYIYPSIPYIYSSNYSDLDLDKDSDLDPDTDKDTKQKPFELLAREPKNDIERVNKKWLENFLTIQGEYPINPSWNLSTPLVKKAIEQVGVEKILNALDTAKKDVFCLNSGYLLKVIMSSNVINRLIHSGSGKHKIAADNISRNNAREYLSEAT